MKTGIYKGDCIEGLSTIPDNSIDLCLTDPPYGIGYQSSWTTDKKDKILNDETPYTEWLAPLFPKMKEGGRLVCFYRWDVQQPFLDEIMRVGFNPKSQIVWDKVGHGMGDLQEQIAPKHELMIYAVKGRYKFQNGRPKSIYKCPRISGENLIHPNEKPIELLQAIIRDLSIPGELVCDPFGGSFSTYLASMKEGRGCISWELHDKYYEIGRSRIETTAITPSLFT